MRVFVVDPPLFTLPYDRHFARALAKRRAEATLVGRPLRGFEPPLGAEPFRFLPLFYRRAENAAASGSTWRTSVPRRLLKGLEHVFGLRALERLCAAERPDVLHLQWLVLPLLDRGALRRIGRHTGLVLTVHDSIALQGAKNASWAQLWGDRESRLIFDRYVAHTEHTRERLRAIGVEDRKISVVPHPLLPVGDPDPGAAAPATPGEGAGPGILFFGQIKPYKGVDVLVEAALRLAARGCRFTVTVAGRPYEPLDGLKAKIEAAGAGSRFRFDLRHVPDDALAAYLARADLVVFPYRHIDASGALTLAIAAGKPIVATRVGVFAEPPNRDQLALVPPDDPMALAEALEPLVRDPAAREALGQRVRRLREGIPSWDRFAEACLSVYAGLGAPRAAPTAAAAAQPAAAPQSSR
jgi:glycosyltransferase involved in cell wall biosynthesis